MYSKRKKVQKEGSCPTQTCMERRLGVRLPPRQHPKENSVLDVDDEMWDALRLLFSIIAHTY